jgi:hypothetical protein
MKSIRKVTRFLALAALAALLFVPRAEATSIVVTPHSQTVGLNSTVTVDIDASAFLPNVVGGASFDLSFNNTILQGVKAVIDPLGMLGANSGELGTGFGAGVYDSFFISLLPKGGLPAQSDPFPLVELTFKAIGTGLSPLNLSVVPAGAFLSDDGGFVIPSGAVNGCVAVTGPNNITAVDPCAAAAAVPEPATFGLLATGLAALVRRRRKTQA